MSQTQDKPEAEQAEDAPDEPEAKPATPTSAPVEPVAEKKDPTPLTLFICRRNVPCHKCHVKARHECKVCALPLCTNHARKASDEYRCATHAPMTQNSTMPKPPRKIET